MLRAAIDIGSNSVRLLVARVDGGEFKPLVKRIETTRLHEGLGEGNVLSADSMARTAGAIERFAAEAKANGVGAEDIFAFATSAVRDAANGREFMDMVARECGVTIRLLSGEQEAGYAYYAAARPGECGVLDIGGASTEMICGCDGRIRAAYSAQMGAVRLRRMLGGPEVRPLPEDMIARALTALRPGIEQIAPVPAQFVGVAGTITTLYALKIGLKEYDPDVIQGGWLARAEVEEWFYRLCGMSVAERLTLPGMPARRADIIDYGAAVLVAFMRLSGLEGIYVSDRDNLYSAVMLCGGDA